MDFKKLLLVACLGLLWCHSSFGCGGESSCGQSTSLSCGEGPGKSCDCTDPACRQDNPCLSPSRCCEAFGNIGGIEGFPND